MTDEEFIKKYGLETGDAKPMLDSLREFYDPKGSHGELVMALDADDEFDDDELQDLHAKMLWGDPDYTLSSKTRSEPYTSEFRKELEELVGAKNGFPVRADESGAYLPFSKMNAGQALAALNRRYPGAFAPENSIAIENPEQAQEDFEQVLEDIQSAYKDHGYSEGLDDWLSELPLGDEAAGFESVLKMLTGKSSKELSPKFLRDLKAYLHAENGLPWELLNSDESSGAHSSVPQGNSAQQEADDRQSRITNAVKESE